MMEYKYSRIKAVWCRLFGHNWMAFDFGVDKCLRCNKERYGAWSSLDSAWSDLNRIKKAISG